MDKIVANLAHRAYRRPVTQAEVAALLRFVALAQSRGETTEQGIQLAIRSHAGDAPIPFPHRARSQSHRRAGRPPHFGHRTGLAPQLFPVELHARRRTASVWPKRAKLHDPAVLDAQVKRMMADRRSAAFAANFAGQWLEIRNLDVVKPDPG